MLCNWMRTFCNRFLLFLNCMVIITGIDIQHTKTTTHFRDRINYRVENQKGRASSFFEERYHKQRLEWMLTNHPNLQKKKTRWFINVMIYFHFCHSTTQPEVLDKVSFASCNSGIIDGLKPRYYSRKNRIECVSNHTRCVM